MMQREKQECFAKKKSEIYKSQLYGNLCEFCAKLNRICYWTGI